MEAQSELPSDEIRIDSIVILKNWRSRDAIIREELGFWQGDLVRKSAIDTAIIRLWNVGNFAKVRYELDTFQQGKNLLKIIAQDALTIVPILSFSGNRKDWSLSLGVSDNNFLGRNIELDVSGTMGTNLNNFKLGVTIPRQLLYKNMSVSGNVSYGQGTNYRFENREKTSVVAYSIEQISGGISNPWHEDFKYRFSPNFGWSLFRHKTDTTLAHGEVAFPDQYKIQYLALSVGESVGYVQRKRHQKNGFETSIGIGAGIGLDKDSPAYFSVNYGLRYYKLFNRMLQLSALYSTGFTSSDIPSLLYYLGANNVKGILTGEISGKAYYTGYLGMHLTYVNRDWFALEQSFYVNWGNGKDTYLDLYKTEPLYGVGTGFYMNIPMIPWLGIRFYFTYSGQNSNWFRLEL
jgi:outer membrane protein assembly factor BamA